MYIPVGTGTFLFGFLRSGVCGRVPGAHARCLSVAVPSAVWAVVWRAPSPERWLAGCYLRLCGGDTFPYSLADHTST